MEKVLIIGNETDFVKQYAKVFNNDYVVTKHDVLKDGIASALDDKHDIIIVDLFLLVELLSSVLNTQKILLISDVISEEEKLSILENSNIDFIENNHDSKIVVQKVKRMLSSFKDCTDDGITLLRGGDDVKVDLLYRSVTVNGKEINLTSKEFMLLSLFLVNKNTTLSRKEISENIWKLESNPNPRSIDILIVKLRKKINTKHIVSKRGVGYTWVEK